MAQITITGPDGKTLTLTAPDGASDEQVNAKIAEVKQNWSQFANLDTRKPEMRAPQQAKEDVSVASDVAKSLGSGVVRGGIGLVGLPGLAEHFGRKGINALGGNVSAETALPMYGDIEKGVEGVVGPLYRPQTTAGEYAQTIGEFAPGVLFPVAGAATRAGQIAARVGGGVVAPAVTSETAGQLTKGTSAEPFARIAGGLAGGFAASRALSPIGGGRNASPEHMRHVQRLRAEGVEPSAAQATGARPLKWAEQVAQDVPFGPGVRHVEQRSEQFTRAALRRAGIDAPRATDEVLDAAYGRIENVFNTVGQRAVLRANPRSQTALRGMMRDVQDYFDTTAEVARAPAVAQAAANISEAYRFRQITGPMYTAWRSQFSRLARNLKSQPEAQRAMNQIVHRLDDIMAPSLTPEARQQLVTARREYRNLLAIEDAAGRAGEGAAQGLISPSALKNAVKKQNARSYARGRGDLAGLARSGEAVLKELPQSGTAPRAMAMGLLTGLGGGTAGPVGALGAIAAPAIAARTLTNPVVQRYLSNQAGAVINPRASAVAAIPGIATNYQQGMRPDLPLSDEERAALSRVLSR